MAYIPIVNVGITDVLLYPRTSLGVLSSAQVISLPPGVTEVRPTRASVSSQVTSRSVPDKMETVNLSALPESERLGVRNLLQKFHTVFSTHKSDLGSTKLLSHDIPLLDDVPVWQIYPFSIRPAF